MSETVAGAGAPMMEETAAGLGGEPPRAVEEVGSTVPEAVVAALNHLGVSREQVEVEVLSAGSRPVPGERLSGSGQARVRVRVIDAYASTARQLLEELLVRMEIPARVSVRNVPPPDRPSDRPPPCILDISGDDLGLLIGWRGENLRALQTVVNLMTGDNEAEGRRVILDVERYRARREDQVRELALRLAHRVKRTGEAYALEPMQAYERRVIHVTLEKDEGVRTESAGAEGSRRVTIHPTGPARPDLEAVYPGAGPYRSRTGGRGDGGRGGGGRPGGFRGGSGERRPFPPRSR